MENTAKHKVLAKELAELYQSAVQDELGMVAKIDDDRVVLFKYPELGTMFFTIDATGDPEYLMLVFPNFANKEALNLTREQLLIAINEVNTRNKAVKLCIRADTINDSCEVLATIECFVGAPDTAPTSELVRAVIKRNVSALRAGVRSLVKAAQDIAPEAVLPDALPGQETI